MSNIKQIQPKQIWTEKGDKVSTLFALTNFANYHFDNGAGLVSYKLIGMESPGTTTDENGNTVNLPESAVDYYFGQINIPASVIQQWGTDDGIIFEYVATTLGLTIINN